MPMTLCYYVRLRLDYRLLKICELYSDEHAVLYNPKKSAMVICKNEFTKNVMAPIFKINGVNIPEVSKVKYLGHIICNDMKDDLDILRQRRQYAGSKVSHVLCRCQNKALSHLLHPIVYSSLVVEFF